jgi:redox-sensitive bicupin YhaK (pirin superfamily)
MYHFQPRPQALPGMGAFKLFPVLPGWTIEGHDDHGYGPLARFDLSQMDPGGHVPMHPHENDEIVTYMLQGVLRHADSAGSAHEITPDKLMAMNAGHRFEHEEGVARGGIRAKWIQIFVRPRQADLEPGVQIVDLPVKPRGQWRHLVGNEQSGAPAFVRNEVDIFDIRTDAAELTAPAIAGRHAFVHVLEGEASLAGQALRAGEGILLRTDAPARIQTRDATGLLLFLVAPDAPITRTGTIGR